MSAGTAPSTSSPQATTCANEPDRRAIFVAAVLALLFIVLTRLPVARTEPFESDEFGFLEQVEVRWFPMHHTLFLTFARLAGRAVGDAYRGFIVIDLLTSALALFCLWWFLRALVRPATAAAAAVLLAVSPVFWGYGAMAGNYTAIVAVGSFLFGVAYRGRSQPRPWHPNAAAVVLALGAGYRPDIGTLWIAVFGVILWQHRWKRALRAGVLFTVVNLAWLSAMLHDVGGWARYRELSAEYAYQCGYLNSIWHLGFFDAPVRYAVKLGMALLWTLGPALILIPAGSARLGRTREGRFLCGLMALAAVPALCSHLLVQFGVAGWSFHYVPALLTLCAVGAEGARIRERLERVMAAPVARWLARESAGARLLVLASFLAGLFLFYPTDYTRPGWRGSFDLSFCRFTRIGLRSPIPDRAPAYWRTANSRPLAGTPARQNLPARAGAG
jgi:Dolichyl-phosphate-mannose-protein mannosyltransferase